MADDPDKRTRMERLAEMLANSRRMTDIVAEFCQKNGNSPDLHISSREKLKYYISNFFENPATRGFEDRSHPGRYVFYNQKDNVAVVIDQNHPDASTILRPANAALFLKELTDKAANGSKLSELERAPGRTLDSLIRIVPSGDLRLGPRFGRSSSGYDYPGRNSLGNSITQRGKNAERLGARFENAAADEAARVEGFCARMGTRLSGPLRVGGTALKVVGLGLTVKEMSELGERAEQAQKEGLISEKALKEYKNLLAGHPVKLVDPSIVGSEIIMDGLYTDWARSNGVREGLLREALRPPTLLGWLGFRPPTDREYYRKNFYDSLPDHVTADMPPGIADLVRIKEQLRFAHADRAGFDMTHLIPSPRDWQERSSRYDDNISDLEDAFAALYDQRFNDGTISAWRDGQNPQAPPANNAQPPPKNQPTPAPRH